MTIKNIIGKKVKIIDAKNPSNIGIEGTIIDETKNMIIIDSGKKIIKKNVVIQIDDKIIDGKKITKKIEERIKG